MEENLNLINEFYLPKVEKDFLDNSSAVKILNDNKIDNHELLGIDKDKDAGDIQLTYKDEKEKYLESIGLGDRPNSQRAIEAWENYNKG